MKINTSGTSWIKKAQPIEPKTDSVVTKKTTPIPSWRQVKEVAKNIVIKNQEKSKSTPQGKVIKYSKVDLKHLSDYQDEFATHLYNKCMEVMPNVIGKYSCESIVKTYNGENWSWVVELKSWMVGSNGYSDYWLCQLNMEYHMLFIKSKDFKDPYKQLDYCLWVWQDAYKKWTMPRYAHEVHDYRYDYKTQQRRINMRKNVLFIK